MKAKRIFSKVFCVFFFLLMFGLNSCEGDYDWMFCPDGSCVKKDKDGNVIDKRSYCGDDEKTKLIQEGFDCS